MEAAVVEAAAVEEEAVEAAAVEEEAVDMAVEAAAIRLMRFPMTASAA